MNPSISMARLDIYVKYNIILIHTLFVSNTCKQECLRSKDISYSRAETCSKKDHKISRIHIRFCHSVETQRSHWFQI